MCLREFKPAAGANLKTLFLIFEGRLPASRARFFAVPICRACCRARAAKECAAPCMCALPRAAARGAQFSIRGAFFCAIAKRRRARTCFWEILKPAEISGGSSLPLCAWRRMPAGRRLCAFIMLCAIFALGFESGALNLYIFCAVLYKGFRPFFCAN